MIWDSVCSIEIFSVKCLTSSVKTMPAIKRNRSTNDQFYAIKSTPSLQGPAIFTHWTDCENLVKDEGGDFLPPENILPQANSSRIPTFVNAPP